MAGEEVGVSEGMLRTRLRRRLKLKLRLGLGMGMGFRVWLLPHRPALASLPAPKLSYRFERDDSRAFLPLELAEPFDELNNVGVGEWDEAAGARFRVTVGGVAKLYFDRMGPRNCIRATLLVDSPPRGPPVWS